MPKRPKSKSKGRKVAAHKLYQVKEGKLVRTAPSCPKCKSFMAAHKDRIFCGKCGYAELKK